MQTGRLSVCTATYFLGCGFLIDWSPPTVAWKAALSRITCHCFVQIHIGVRIFNPLYNDCAHNIEPFPVSEFEALNRKHLQAYETSGTNLRQLRSRAYTSSTGSILVNSRGYFRKGYPDLAKVRSFISSSQRYLQNLPLSVFFSILQNKLLERAEAEQRRDAVLIYLRMLDRYTTTGVPRGDTCPWIKPNELFVVRIDSGSFMQCCVCFRK